MNEKQRKKWQRGASSILEPGEQVELDKRSLSDASLSFDRKRVALDEMNHAYVGWLPSAKRRAHQFVAAGTLSQRDGLASA